ncbi:DUF1722 domain-containing protein [Alginatibacterium sediminis]|uniref:DUF1722 domain-containing protein n=1 Tax=Alginatibacterium sediminis TaxID=2164068 RepID=A0A420E899_9ALTE|nr:DUF523 and DUF1722 domain-containing protein [Alginatibacterium sediminis]RKF15706.1 DUF1722 domain-containing protein [Alginatibacterium sediminis]
MSEKIQVGISACLVGDKVRFDGGHKQSRYCLDVLSEYFEYVRSCPEMAIGMGTPRKTIRLLKGPERIEVVASDGSFEVTDKLLNYSDERVEQLEHLDGYIVCAKSPSCGMERVSVFDPEKNMGSRDGVGVFTRKLMDRYPYLPVEEDGRLNDPHLRENFITRVYAHQAWRELKESGLTVSKVMSFHSRYKYLLMAHNQGAYRELGPIAAKLKGNDDHEGFESYFQSFMTTLKYNPSRKNHSNVMQHLQGYLKTQLNARQKQELGEQIDKYREGTLPLFAPLTLLKHYLNEFPNEYLAMQTYLDPYPEALKLRYAL